jgi:hypothetical protein
MYANNEPADGARTKMNSWQAVVQPYVKYGAKGFGLSDQSWMCANELTCPPDELVNWATTAFSSGALVVQTEPTWYWWNFPVGAIGQQTSNYTQDPKWANRGYASANLQLWASNLGLTLPAAPVSTVLTNNASCVNVTAPDYVKPGQAFTATVTMKNTGTKPWVAQNSSLSWDIYHIGALDFQQPPYTSSKWGQTDYALQDKTTVNPGDQTTFTLTPTATTTEGTYDFSWQMFEHGVEWFGATCGKNIIVSSKTPPSTNPQAVCASPGKLATISWTAPAGYNTFYLRLKLWPYPTDGTAIAWNDSFVGTSYTFNTTPGLSYNWWVQTKNLQTGDASDAAGSTFVCPTH